MLHYNIGHSEDVFLPDAGLRHGLGSQAHQEWIEAGAIRAGDPDGAGVRAFSCGASSGASIERVQLPAPDQHDQHAADQCDICAVTAMAGTLLAASPPVLVLPLATDFRLVTTRAVFAPRGASDLAFQPRAPPLS